MNYLPRYFQVDTSIGGQYSLLTERKLCGIILGILIFFSILIADDFTFYALQAKKLDRECKGLRFLTDITSCDLFRLLISSELPAIY